MNKNKSKHVIEIIMITFFKIWCGISILFGLRLCLLIIDTVSIWFLKNTYIIIYVVLSNAAPYTVYLSLYIYVIMILLIHYKIGAILLKNKLYFIKNI